MNIYSWAKALALFLLLFILKLNNKKNQNMKILIKYNNESLKGKNNQNNIYKELLKLYLEDREKFYLKGREYKMHKKIDVYNESKLITIQDKLNYLLVRENPENKTELVDKILLRNYSQKILGKDICVPIIKIYNDVDDINLDELPEKFVLKCNHGSGMNIICKDKKKFNLTHAKEKLKKWLEINYGLKTFEYQYLNIKKKIFAEKYLADNIIDYKFNCFNGEPKFIRIKTHINGKNLNNHYTLNWTLTNIELNYGNFVRDPKINITRPINLDKMIYYAKLLSSDFCFCRVDFYEIDKIVYLGELTFSPFNLYMKYNNEKMRIYLGNLLNITKIKN